ncbi:Chemotaxis protein methyltransferase [Gemmata obscuriglobus]|uniref:protein-glutamate O-methyltransferase n=1 Tax=Gemmata obscuriglobus TaxID=114 RepID=A0A2Z3H1U5_9BACT|nr:protein-glutamate O-methyltransferase CheR [Gemmata obscuriglobus]AWM35594.1 protein-glutamate O-methyltransferase CheR [Gemmata obscuriglobus]QEG31883.1 Chemotaxis protein methyltransferase [Gemmata obscuriglobus]VTS11229.1 chemotaxis protein : Methylase of chemotaxis methyl-accepting protein OS=Oscillatoria acuminata PCC 6304 GN=Oscil6304_4194 PE=4 SV=1: CheR_N: CheR [Gemmata obscuriglobus UQM 2246]
MTPAGEQPELPLGTFVILRDLIRDRIGVSFEDEKRDLLGSKLTDRVRDLKLDSFLDYYYLLKYGPGSDEEWPHLTDALSVQETYFWREHEQVRALVDVLVPQHVAAGRGPVRVWSAACATGEEPLSIAIALNEAGWFDRADVEVWASDVSPAALEKARRGVYRERSFRVLPPHLREKYFAPAEGGTKVAPELHARVQFRPANLLNADDTRALAAAPFIFCRNVFIYFSAATVARVVRGFAERTPAPAYLFTGAAESLLRVASAFQLEEIAKAFVYVKR